MNVIWFQDFPRFPPNQEPDFSERRGFQATLLSFLGGLGMPLDAVSEFSCFDFSNARARLVVSVPGVHSEDGDQQYGMYGLEDAIKNSPLTLSPPSSTPSPFRSGSFRPSSSSPSSVPHSHDSSSLSSLSQNGSNTDRFSYEEEEKRRERKRRRENNEDNAGGKGEGEKMERDDVVVIFGAEEDCEKKRKMGTNWEGREAERKEQNEVTRKRKKASSNSPSPHSLSPSHPPIISKKHTIYYQTSSMGSLNPKWCSDFLTRLDLALSFSYPPSSSSFSSTSSFPSSSLSSSSPDFKVIYPTKKTVLKWPSPSDACQIFFSAKFWNAPYFPKRKLCDVMPPGEREGRGREFAQPLLHSKIIIGAVDVEVGEGGSSSLKSTGWVYIGSHNFSQAAWGKIDSKRKLISITNYELGILLFPHPPSEGGGRGEGGEGEWERLVSAMPFKVPPPPYREGEEPWVTEY